MKKYYMIIVIALSFTSYAQTKLDSMLINVNKSTVTSGIIYERVA